MRTGALGRSVVASGRFVRSFLVGDTPELFLAALVIVAAAFALADHNVAGVVALPAIAVVSVGWSAARGRRRSLSAATRAPGRRTRGSRDAPPAGA